MNRNYRVIAHTGCMNTKMNSLESIRAGIRAGAAYIEIDVRFSPSSPVLTHDPIVPGNSYLSLEEALGVIREVPGLNVALDLKEWDRIGELASLLEACDMLGRAVYLGNFMEDMDQMLALGRGVPCFPNVYPEQVRELDEEELDRLAQKVRSAGATAVGMNHIAVTKQVADAWHRHGVLLSVWTVDDPDEVEKMAAYGADFITSNRLDLL